MPIQIKCDKCDQEAGGRWLEKPLTTLPPRWLMTTRFYDGFKHVLSVLCPVHAEEFEASLDVSDNS